MCEGAAACSGATLSGAEFLSNDNFKAILEGRNEIVQPKEF